MLDSSLLLLLIDIAGLIGFFFGGLFLIFVEFVVEANVIGVHIEVDIGRDDLGQVRLHPRSGGGWPGLQSDFEVVVMLIEDIRRFHVIFV